MHSGSNGQRNGGVAAANGRNGMRRRWRHSRSILKEGLEAALRTSPEVLENCKPKTNYGALVRGLVLEAARCKATPLKTVMSLIDWDGEDEDDEEGLEEDRRDWSPDGVWETMPEPEPRNEPAEKQEGPAQKELKRRLTRLVEAGQHEHAARIVAAIRGRLRRPGTGFDGIALSSPGERSEMGEGDREAGASATADAVEGESHRHRARDFPLPPRLCPSGFGAVPLPHALCARGRKKAKVNGGRAAVRLFRLHQAGATFAARRS